MAHTLRVRGALFATIVPTVILFLIPAVPGYGQTSGQKPAVERVAAPRTDPSSGAEMFTAYCAACHGRDAKGNGPAAVALKIAPTDLTQLSVKNQGKFPQADFEAAVERGPVGAHGSTEMPVWGPVFRRLGDAQLAMLRVANLRRYVEELQGK